MSGENVLSYFSCTWYLHSAALFFSSVYHYCCYAAKVSFVYWKFRLRAPLPFLLCWCKNYFLKGTKDTVADADAVKPTERIFKRQTWLLKPLWPFKTYSLIFLLLQPLLSRFPSLFTHTHTRTHTNPHTWLHTECPCSLLPRLLFDVIGDERVHSSSQPTVQRVKPLISDINR